MATITKRLDQFHFPDLCGNCQAPAEIVYPLVTQTGIDMIAMRHVTYVTLPVPVCAECYARRKNAGWIALAGIAGAIALIIVGANYGPRDHRGAIESYLIFTAALGVLLLVWYWRNWLRRDLDKSFLGVRGKEFTPATNELTLWFRDTASPLDQVTTSRFVADPSALESIAQKHSDFVTRTQRSIEKHDQALAQHRPGILSELESQSFRMQVNRRPLILVGAIATLILGCFAYSMEVKEVRRNRNDRSQGVPLAGILLLGGTVLLCFSGITIEVSSGQIVRSFWGLKKRLDRSTTIVKTYGTFGANSYALEDARGTKLTVTNHLQNYDLLLTECQLRTDELNAHKQ